MMMDEFRSHDPKPNAQERAWMATNPFAMMARLLALATLAVAIGFTASHGYNDTKQQTVASRAE